VLVLVVALVVALAVVVALVVVVPVALVVVELGVVTAASRPEQANMHPAATNAKHVRDFMGRSAGKPNASQMPSEFA
jgi:hypothetical protein